MRGRGKLKSQASSETLKSHQRTEIKASFLIGYLFFHNDFYDGQIKWSLFSDLHKANMLARDVSKTNIEENVVASVGPYFLLIYQ